MQFTNRSQEFLGGVFYRFPQIEGAFRHYESLPPAGRMHRAELQSQTIARRIWTELGIDPQDCETLSEHTARMLFLFKRYPAPRFDKDELQQQIMVWAVPRVLADELPLELMGWEDRHRLRLLAIDMVFESSPARADRARVMLTPRDPEGRSYDDESAFVNDLDFICTAIMAQSYKKSHPHCSGNLDNILRNCFESLMTVEGAAIWVSALSSPSPPVPKPYDLG